MFKCVLRFLPFLCVQSAFSLFDVSVDSGYMSSTLTNTVINSATAADGNGYIVNGAAHINFTPNEIFRFGIGPDFAYGAQSLKFPSSTATTNIQKAQRIGVDAYLLFEVVPIVKPFVRARMGKEWLTNTNTGTVSGQTSELVTEYGSIYYDLLLGANYPIFDVFSVYAQFGATGSMLSQATLKSYTLGGAPQPFNFTSQTYFYSGFMASLGVMLSF
jgi:hypothetical protein